MKVPHGIKARIHRDELRRELIAQLNVAKKLIHERRYEEALTLLARIRHPKARAWELKLKRISQREPDFLHDLD
jgi:hypothetical protein